MDLTKYQAINCNSTDEFRQIYKFWSDSLNQKYLGLQYPQTIKKLIEKKIGSLRKNKCPTLLEVVGYGTYIEGMNESIMIIAKYYPKIIQLSFLLETSKNRQNNTISDTERYIIAIGIAHGMKYLHSKKKYHSNLMPSEIFIDENYCPHVFYLNLDIDSSDTDTTNIYSSSKLLEQKEFDKNDIYAYSIIVYQLLTKNSPSKININYLTKTLQGIGDKFTEFFTCCWNEEDIKDTSFEDIYEWLLDEDVQKEFGDIKKAKVEKFLKFINSENDETETSESQDDADEPSKETAHTEEKKIEKKASIKYETKDELTEGDSPSDSDVAKKDKKKKKRKRSKEETSEDKSTDSKTKPKKDDNPSDSSKDTESNEDTDSSKKDTKIKKKNSNKSETKESDDEQKEGQKDKSNKDADDDDDTGDGDVDDDKEESKRMFLKGKAFYDGKDCEISFTEAAKYFKMAADKGYVRAMNWYGDMLRFGLGVDFNYKEALKYYKKSSDNHDERGEKRYIALQNKIKLMST